MQLAPYRPKWRRHRQERVPASFLYRGNQCMSAALTVRRQHATSSHRWEYVKRFDGAFLSSELLAQTWRLSTKRNGLSIVVRQGATYGLICSGSDAQR